VAGPLGGPLPTWSPATAFGPRRIPDPPPEPRSAGLPARPGGDRRARVQGLADPVRGLHERTRPVPTATPKTPPAGAPWRRSTPAAAR
jgi:hypothetical protein